MYVHVCYLLSFFEFFMLTNGHYVLFEGNTKRVFRNTRVVGGDPVSSEENFPLQVSIQRLKINGKKEHFCGGALIKNGWIVTAAHCSNAINLNSTTVLVGVRCFEDNNTEYHIQRIMIHPQYDDNSLKNDVALLELIVNKPVKIGDHPVSPIAILKGASSGSCFVCGFGKTKYSGNATHVLQKAKVSVLSKSECIKTLMDNYFDEIPEGNICAGGEGHDACQGDSGSPIICSDADGKIGVLGISSWGFGCGGPLPGVYITLYYYSDWIFSIVQKTE